MTPAQQSQLVTLVVLAALIGLVMARRMRPQPVRPQRIAISGVIIVLVIGASLFSGRQLIENPVSVALIPVFVVYGSAFGGTSSAVPAPHAGGQLVWLSDVSADLLFLSLGLWASRAFFLIQRHRAS